METVYEILSVGAILLGALFLTYKYDAEMEMSFKTWLTVKAGRKTPGVDATPKVTKETLEPDKEPPEEANKVSNE
ncbi:hypothetical protein [Amycolatopsis kentuckyensis]|uniref:hypothetical protein n=1 Tax=Amycolatopsis kentuckyensis TaxID=218823 RepID=UPI003565219E